MFTFKCIKPAFFDVDSTLIEWRPSEDRKEIEGVECKWEFESLAIDAESGRLGIVHSQEEDVFIPIQANIDQLKEHKRRGHTVIVWSAGGGEWAAKAIKMLNLENYVDLAIDKPTSIYDDKALEDFMPKVQFCIDEEVSKVVEKLLKKSNPVGAMVQGSLDEDGVPASFGERATSAISPSRADRRR
jgi:hypothetical protein